MPSPRKKRTRMGSVKNPQHCCCPSRSARLALLVSLPPLLPSLSIPLKISKLTTRSNFFATDAWQGVSAKCVCITYKMARATPGRNIASWIQ